MTYTSKWIIILSIIVGLALMCIAKKVVAPQKVEGSQPTQVTDLMSPVEECRTRSCISELIHQKSLKYNVSEAVINTVVRCESSFNPSAVGDNGTSFGLVQIHQPSHPNITKQQAFDPDFALEFLASELSKGNGRIWTCYRLLFS